MKRLLFITAAFFLALALHGKVHAARVTIEYVAEASTVTGQPFGLTVPRLTEVKGYMTYETNTSDLRPADAMRGDFVMAGTWDFRAEFLGKIVRGSGTASASTNLFGSPTLRFNDGARDHRAGIMSFDGIADATIGLSFSISGQAKDLPTDQLPVNFTFNPPPQGASHTFVLDNQSGSMLLQFISFRQVDLKIHSLRHMGDNVEIVWTSVQGKRYELEFSTDLEHWTKIRTNLTGSPQSTTLIDPISSRYSGNPPSKGFYRILDPPL